MKVERFLQYIVPSFLLFIFSFNLIAQVAILSPDKTLYAASYDKGSRETEIKITNIATGKEISSMTVRNKSAAPIKDIIITAHNQSVIVQQGKRQFTLFELKKGWLVNSFTANSFACAGSQNFYVMPEVVDAKVASLEVFNSLDGEKQWDLKFKGYLEKLWVSQSDQYIVAKRRGTNDMPYKFFSVETHNSRPVFNSDCNNFRFIDKDKFLVLFEEFEAMLYKLPEFEEVHSIFRDMDTERYKPFLDELSLMNAEEKDKTYNYAVSPNGKMLSMYANDIQNIRKRGKVFVIDIKSGVFISDFVDEKNRELDFSPGDIHVWQNDSTLLVGEIVLDINSRKAIGELDDAESRYLHLSPDRKYRIRKTTTEKAVYIKLNIGKDIASDGIILDNLKGDQADTDRDELLKPKEYKIDSAEFVSFSFDSKYVFIKRENGLVDYIELDKLGSMEEFFDYSEVPKDEQIADKEVRERRIAKRKAENKNTVNRENRRRQEREKKEYVFKQREKEEKEKKNYVTRERTKRKRREYTNEGRGSDRIVVPQDLPPPPGYRYIRIKKFLGINQPAGSDIELSLKSVRIRNDSVDLNVHLLDTAGNYYYGAAGKDLSNWCELLVKYPNGTVQAVDTFTVTEHRDTTDLPDAFVMVLDHSRSMGNHRAFILQDGVEQFIEKKRPHDALAVIKYDCNVEVEAELTTSSDELKEQLRKNGLDDFGGSTSILDGITEGVKVLMDKEGYKRRMVVLLTDGVENCSRSKKNSVLRKALKNGIQVSVIGFGNFVSQPYLQSIAYNTGGSLYQIYDTENLGWIYDDVARKEQNYYSIKFKSDSVGKHIAMLKLCTEKNEDTLFVAFDNIPLHIEEIEEDGNDAFGIPIARIDPTEMDLETFLKPKIYPGRDEMTYTTFPRKEYFKELEMLAPDEYKYLIEEYLGKPDKNIGEYSIEAEFNNLTMPDIKFVFDKTEIVKGTDKGIEELIEFLNENPQVKIGIYGHTDSFGSDAYNQKLSERRANVVKLILTRAGIADRRIHTRGYSESDPLVKNSTDKNRLKNRRVEFRLVE